MQQLSALLVLYEELSNATQHLAILLAVPAEEYLILTEYARHAIYWHSTMLQNVEVVVPELVLNEECHNRTHSTQEASRVAYCVERQIAYNVGTLIVLAHLIARRREEGK